MKDTKDFKNLEYQQKLINDSSCKNYIICDIHQTQVGIDD